MLKMRTPRRRPAKEHLRIDKPLGEEIGVTALSNREFISSPDPIYIFLGKSRIYEGSVN